MCTRRERGRDRCYLHLFTPWGERGSFSLSACLSNFLSFHPYIYLSSIPISLSLYSFSSISLFSSLCLCLSTFTFLFTSMCRSVAHYSSVLPFLNLKNSVHFFCLPVSPPCKRPSPAIPLPSSPPTYLGPCTIYVYVITPVLFIIIVTWYARLRFYNERVQYLPCKDPQRSIIHILRVAFVCESSPSIPIKSRPPNYNTIKCITVLWCGGGRRVISVIVYRVCLPFCAQGSS